MKISSNFTFDHVRFDSETAEHLVISLTAPQVETAKRPPLCIILVADNSGSMQGQKLHYAKLSMSKLVDNLAPGDTCGLVVFSTNAQTLYHPTKMTAANKDVLRGKIASVSVEGGTNFSAGMLLGCEIANKLDMPASTVVRVIMFSDGQPERGIARTQPELLKLLNGKKERASISMFGFGDDADHDLLGALSRDGQGNYAHIKDPDSAVSAFGKELGGLLSSYADDIFVRVTPHAGHTIGEVLSDLEVEEEDDGEIEVKIPPMLAEETQHIVLSMNLAAQKSAGPRAVNAVSIHVGWRTLENGEPVRKVEDVKAKVQFVKPGDEQQKATKEWDEIVGRQQLAKAQQAAELSAKTGNWHAAQQVFANVQQDLTNRGHDQVGAAAAYTSQLYLNSDSYDQAAGGRNAIRTSLTRGGTRVSHISQQDEAVLLAAGVGMSTASQTASRNAFVVTPAVQPEVPAIPPIDMSQILNTPGGIPLASSGFVATDTTGLPNWLYPQARWPDGAGASSAGASSAGASSVQPVVKPKKKVSKSRTSKW